MGKFIVKATETGTKFDLLCDKGTVLLTSEVYSSENACLNGVESVKKSCGGGVEDQTGEGLKTLSHPKFEVYADQAGKFRFRLKAVNGQIVASSKPFAEKKECLDFIEAIKKTAPDAPVEK